MIRPIFLTSILVSLAACAPPETERVAEERAALDDGPTFYTWFLGDGDQGQCTGGAYGGDQAAFGAWTGAMRIDTDDRPGGCIQQFAVADPNGAVAGLGLSVDIEADGDPGQCGDAGARDIPIVHGIDPQWSRAYRIDTDSRAGGCQQTFSLRGRDDVALDIAFFADDDPGQCANEGIHTVTSGHPVTVRLDTDGRAGGCRQSFRLRKVQDGCGRQGCDAPPIAYDPCPTSGDCSILPLGDSITVGYNANDLHPEGGPGGYRVEALKRAMRDHKSMTFVGLHQEEGPTKPVVVGGLPFHFPRWHDGYGGYGIETEPNDVIQPEDCQTGISLLCGILPFAGLHVAVLNPHIVTLMIGANNISHVSDAQTLEKAPEYLERLLDSILTVNPNGLLLVAQITQQATLEQEAQAVTYNGKVADLVRARAAAGHPIALVDLHGAMASNARLREDYLSDSVHPTEAGYAVIGAAWYNAIGPLLH